MGGLTTARLRGQVPVHAVRQVCSRACDDRTVTVSFERTQPADYLSRLATSDLGPTVANVELAIRSQWLGLSPFPWRGGGWWRSLW